VLSLLIPFMVVVGVVWAVFPAYWELAPPVLEAGEIRRGVTEDGFPWIGAQDPELTVIEFSDYLCFQCRKMHFYLRQLVAEHPDRIRLVHRHFPMQQGFNPLVTEAFHTGSGPMALLALAAAAQGKFWEMNDLLYEMADQRQDFSVKTLAEALALEPDSLSRSLGDPRLRLQLQEDIRDGLKLGITGTPGFVIDGNLYQGYIPPEIIERVID
jgi:protein-disulfide isomerase